jgi:hypothetical protein
MFFVKDVSDKQISKYSGSNFDSLIEDLADFAVKTVVVAEESDGNIF